MNEQEKRKSDKITQVADKQISQREKDLLRVKRELKFYLDRQKG